VSEGVAQDFDAVWFQVSRIDGWLTREQARKLFRAASSVPQSSAIVELGSHHGRSTIVLANAKPPSTRCVAVDPFDDPRWGGGAGARDLFLTNLERAGVRGQVTPLTGTSQEAGRAWQGGPVGLMYADGSHERSAVLADIELWRPHVTTGGWMFFHDAFSSVGVTLAILQRQLFTRSFRYMGSTGSLAGFRSEAMSLWGAVWNGTRLLARLPYFARNLVVKYALRRQWNWCARLLGHRGTECPY
jgi:predicted O-methyltransferase YrrM